MKILMLCYEYPPIGGGGAKVVHGLTSELVKKGHKVDLVTMGYKNLPKYEKKENLNIYRVQCVRLRSNICTPPEMVTYLLAAIPLMLRLCKQNNYDINHTHFIYPDGILAYIINKLTGLPYVVTAHGSDVPGYNPDRFKILHKLLTPLWRIITSKAEKIIIPSNSLDNLVKKATTDIQTTVIPNGINLNKFSANGKKENKILVVGRMFERKGIQYFIHALSGLNHNFTVNIVGEGPYLNNLKKLTKDSPSNINFLGFLDNNSEELQRLYESSKIFVMPSESENFPIVLLEAMTAGLAIITTNDTGCTEVVGDSALLINSKDSGAIKDALLKLINDPNLRTRLGKAARKRAEENFSWENVVIKHINLYSSLRRNKLTNTVKIQNNQLARRNRKSEIIPKAILKDYFSDNSYID
jgi:glycosyltransferase involved in cell wall biosynthesis